MKASEVVFQSLLNGKIQYRVPLFQRTYSWDGEDWQRLWDDLLDIYDLTELRSHFLGAVVTLPIDSGPEDAAKYMLIDGQQRFTTLLILLAAIRDLAREGDPTAVLAAQIDQECLLNTFAVREDEHFKLKPTQQDSDDFVDVLKGKPAPAASSRVWEARQFFTKKLAEGDLTGTPISAGRLKSCITDYLTLVSITLDKQDSPHRIFESLNNTGEPLTASDLVRNHVFMRIPSEAEQRRAYDEHWYPMQARMEAGDGTSGLTDFFWRFQMMLGELPRYDEVFEAMRRWIEAFVQQDDQAVVTALAELDRFSELYLRIWRPDAVDQPVAIAAQLSRLNAWEVSVAYPFILRAMDWFTSDSVEVDENKLLEVLRMIESFVVRRLVVGIPTNRLRRVFAGMSKQVTSNDFVASARGYLLANEWPSDEVFHAGFQDAPLYRSARVGRLRQILISLERAYERNEAIAMTDRITVEHVMPQTLSSSWREELGPEVDRIHAQWVHTIGNLTLSGDNTEMGNLPFEKKKEILRDSRFALNRHILESDHWGEAEIRRRATELADKSVSVWPRGEAATSGAVQPQSEEKAWDEVVLIARGCGLDDELGVLVSSARSLGLYARPDKYSVMFTPDSDRQVMLFTVWPQPAEGGSFRVWSSPEAFQRYFPAISAHQAVEAVGAGGKERLLPAADVSDFIDRLRVLLV